MSDEGKKPKRKGPRGKRKIDYSLLRTDRPKREKKTREVFDVGDNRVTWTTQDKEQLLEALYRHSPLALESISNVVRNKTPQQIEEYMNKLVNVSSLEHSKYKLSDKEDDVPPLELWLSLMQELIYTNSMTDVSREYAKVFEVIARNESLPEDSGFTDLKWRNLYLFISDLLGDKMDLRNLSGMESLVMLDLMHSLGDTLHTSDTQQQRILLDLKYQLYKWQAQHPKDNYTATRCALSNDFSKAEYTVTSSAAVPSTSNIIAETVTASSSSSSNPSNDFTQSQIISMPGPSHSTTNGSSQKEIVSSSLPSTTTANIISTSTPSIKFSISANEIVELASSSTVHDNFNTSTTRTSHSPSTTSTCTTENTTSISTAQEGPPEISQNPVLSGTLTTITDNTNKEAPPTDSESSSSTEITNIITQTSQEMVSQNLTIPEDFTTTTITDIEPEKTPTTSQSASSTEVPDKTTNPSAAETIVSSSSTTPTSLGVDSTMMTTFSTTLTTETENCPALSNNKLNESSSLSSVTPSSSSSTAVAVSIDEPASPSQNDIHNDPSPSLTNPSVSDQPEDNTVNSTSSIHEDNNDDVEDVEEKVGPVIIPPLLSLNPLTIPASLLNLRPVLSSAEIEIPVSIEVDEEEQVTELKDG